MQFDLEDKDLDKIAKQLKEELNISDHHFKDALEDLIDQAMGRTWKEEDILYESEDIILVQKS